MEHDLAKLEKRIRDHDVKATALTELGADLIPIIHWPGWTTLAEVKFVELALDSLDAHLDSVGRLRKQLVEAARLVGKDD